MANAHTSIELITMIIINNRIDLRPIFDDK